jgi:hypothetical protein
MYYDSSVYHAEQYALQPVIIKARIWALSHKPSPETHTKPRTLTPTPRPKFTIMPRELSNNNGGENNNWKNTLPLSVDEYAMLINKN